MKILLSWARAEPEMNILIKQIESSGHEITYWIGLHEGRDMTPRKAIFHDHYDAWAGKPADMLKDVPCPPPSKMRIDELFELESTVLTMMNKRYDASPVDERKQIYYDMLAYWTVVLDTVRPDAFICPAVPHSVYDFILLTLAKEKGVSVIMFEDTWVGGRLVWFSDYKKGSTEFAAAILNNSSKKISLSDIGEDLQAYYRSQTGTSTQKPAYMQVQQKQGQGWGLLHHRIGIAFRTLPNGRLFSLLLSFVVRKFRKDLKKEYGEIVKAPDLKKSFVYFPLGFQPERTTSPQGGVFNDQILVAQTLAAALPSGWELYVKEHPSQWWFRSKTQYNCVRYRGYYRRLAAIPRVRVVPIDTDSHALIAASKTVATITGTAGWEALFRFKKPIIFGYPWYLPVSQLRPVESVEDCVKVFNEIEREPHTAEADILRVLKSFEEGTKRAYVGIMRDHLGNLFYDVETTPEESIRTVAEIITTQLRDA